MCLVGATPCGCPSLWLPLPLWLPSPLWLPFPPPVVALPPLWLPFLLRRQRASAM